ncbi:hypothetical protein PV327_010667 [Microctonus hyperodae]|uniref:PNT domain-containing protein n=1 Tax=Microctonus hyperodae TaxID=165561 RepID=A0AA39F0B3_MICHY|nr:hypothetical protein PV327_010667 [Microctonus hyperodae]
MMEHRARNPQTFGADAGACGTFDLSINPRQWSETAVAHWLHWAIREFSLEGVAMQPWQHMTGKQICAMGKDSFLARAPAFMGDILWEHLELLQKEDEVEKASLENMPANLYESVCVPDLGEFLSYQTSNNSIATSEHKSSSNSLTNSTTSTSSSSRNPGQQGIQQSINLPLPRPYHNDGEC